MPKSKDLIIKICLVMIAKNESHIVTNASLPCLTGFIDAWVIDDTGSTDNTIDLIKEFFNEAKIKGEMHETPWRGFNYNRTVNLRHAEEYIRNNRKSHEIWYMFTMDADDLIYGGNVHEYNKSVEIQQFKIDNEMILTKKPDMIKIPIVAGGNFYHRMCFIKYNNELRWKYTGVVHEYLTPIREHREKPKILGFMNTGYYVGRHMGARSKDPSIYLNDAMTMEKRLLVKPDSKKKHRYTFYIAQSYRDARMYKRAEEKFIERANMGGWGEEVYLSYVDAARCRMKQNTEDNANFIKCFQNNIEHTPEFNKSKLYQDTKKQIDKLKNDNVVIEYLISAIDVRPTRLEAPFLYTQILTWKGKSKAAWMFAKSFVRNEYPVNDSLFVDIEIHNWQFLDACSVAAYWAGDYVMSKLLCEKILNLPENKGPVNNNRNRVNKNLEFANTKLESMKEKK